MTVAKQHFLFPEVASPTPGARAASSTFADNTRLPVHRWIRFSAGFSGAWAQTVIADALSRGPTRVFDPFAGAATTLIAAEDAGADSWGIEAHPFVYRIARAKLARRNDADGYLERVRHVRRIASHETASTEQYPVLIRKCYDDASLAELDCLRKAVAKTADGSPTDELVWLTLVGILRQCSRAGTAPWQYVLPRKSKKSPMAPLRAFEELASTICADMRASAQLPGPAAKLLLGDARTCDGVSDGFATLVVTSPPYPNNYDYADATRLEMCFLQEIRGWPDLQSAIRCHLVRSCTQHVPERSVSLNSTLRDPLLEPIADQLSEVCAHLAEIRLTRGGRKTYHLMVACYFLDLARVWHALRRVCASPSQVCFVVGDSAPYGVYVPVMDWLGRLALAAGFASCRFERTRDRNVKWKNRKHRVPLCEGRLWVEG